MWYTNKEWRISVGGPEVLEGTEQKPPTVEVKQEPTPVAEMTNQERVRAANQKGGCGCKKDKPQLT